MAWPGLLLPRGFALLLVLIKLHNNKLLPYQGIAHISRYLGGRYRYLPLAGLCTGLGARLVDLSTAVFLFLFTIHLRWATMGTFARLPFTTLI